MYCTICGDTEHDNAGHGSAVTRAVEHILQGALERDTELVGTLMEWRPIETAPKDGTRVLAWHKDWETAHTAQWYGTYWGVFYKTGPFLYQPTHWMPLPAPPAGAS